MISEGGFIILLLVTVFLGCVYLSYKIDDDEDVHVLLRCLVCVMLTLLLTLPSFMMFRLFDGKESKYWKKKGSIVSMRIGKEGQGSFVLGTGEWNEKEYYYYYYPVILGYKRGKKLVEKTIILESEREKPHLMVESSHWESRSGFISYIDEENEDWILVVPKGTIIRKFEAY